MKTMKAAYLTALGKIETREAPVPVPGAGEVLVRLRRVGICGSDIHYFRNGRIGEQVVEFPFIIGHEAAGEIAGRGPGATRFRDGDPVAVEPGVNCGRCVICRAGRPNLCRQVRFLGTPPVDGAFREYLVAPETALYPMPAGVSADDGALCEPLAVGLYAWSLPRPEPGSTVAVFGCGPIGLSVIFCARAGGAGRILAVEPLPQRRAFARRAGADAVFDPGAEDPAEAIMRVTEGEGAHHVFEAAGQPKALAWAVEAAAVAGRVMIVGIPTGDWSFPASTARRKELFLLNVRRSAFAAERVIAMLAAGRINPAGMITHRFNLETLEKGLRLVGDYRDGVIKAMVEI